MHHRSFAFCALFALLGVTSLACTAEAPAGGESAGSLEQDQVSDIAKMTARGDGSFDVVCRDGRTEIVSADDVTNGRVCKAPVVPPSPFTAGACTGTPMTEAEARARLVAAGASSVKIGSFSLGFRQRDAKFTWDARSKHWQTAYSWSNANNSLVAWRETGISTSSGQGAVFPSKGIVELAKDAQGAPFVRFVSEAANVTGPDTTRFMRFVSDALRPWSQDHTGPRTFTIEERRGAAASWGPVADFGWSVTTADRSHSSWWFIGAETTSILTNRCGQFTSTESLSGLSAVNAALGIWVSLD